MTNYRGKTILITGASSGIGRALALKFAAMGAKVGVTARRQELLETLVTEVRATGGIIAARTCDVSDRFACHSALHELEAELGPCDVLIANAAVSATTGADPMNVEGVVAMTNVNYLGAVFAFEAVLPGMLRRGSGHLAAVSSMAAYKGLPGAAGYCAGKAALSIYCESLRIELWPRGVAVTCIYPGFVSTPMTSTNNNPMPWIMTAERAAEIIARRLPSKPARLHFPYRMKLLMWLSKWAPDRMIRKRVAIKVAVHE